MAYPVVPIPGTGDNGYRPNFTIPGGSSPSNRAPGNAAADSLKSANAATDAARAAGIANQPLGGSNSASAQAGRMAGRATAAAKDYAFGSRPEAKSGWDSLRNRGGAALHGLSRATGAVQFASALGNNMDRVGNVMKGDYTLGDVAGGALEGIGNTVAGGVTGLAKKLPYAGPMISAVVGDNAVSNALDFISPGTSVLNRYNNAPAWGDATPSVAQAAQPPAGQPAAAQPAAAQPAAEAGTNAGFGLRAPQDFGALPEPAPEAGAQAPTQYAPARGQAYAGAPMTGQVTRVGNSYSGTNVGGDISINGGLRGGGGGGGISPQNMAAADNLAASQQRQSMARVVGRERPTAGRLEFRTPQAVHSGNDWSTRQALRNLEIKASSIAGTNRERRAAQAAYAQAMQADLNARMNQPNLQADANRTNAGIRTAQINADASMYNSDNSLRGSMYNSDNSLRSSMYNADASNYNSDNTLRGAMYTADANERGRAAEAAARMQEARDARLAKSAEYSQKRLADNRKANMEAATVFNTDGTVNERETQARRNRLAQSMPGVFDQDPGEFLELASQGHVTLMDQYAQNHKGPVTPVTLPDVRGHQRGVGTWRDSLVNRLPFVTDDGVRQGHYYTQDPVSGTRMSFGRPNEASLEVLKGRMAEKKTQEKQ